MSDFISREAALNAMLDFAEFYSFEIHNAEECVIEYMNAIPAADVKPVRWIPVEEQLPENGVNVLCWYEYYHWSAERVLPEYGIGYCVNGMWGGEVSNGYDCKVLYWMPLPEPPKQEEG